MNNILIAEEVNFDQFNDYMTELNDKMTEIRAELLSNSQRLAKIVLNY